jgi:hypothetical protein
MARPVRSCRQRTNNLSAPPRLLPRRLGNERQVGNDGPPIRSVLQSTLAKRRLLQSTLARIEADFGKAICYISRATTEADFGK